MLITPDTSTKIARPLLVLAVALAGAGAVAPSALGQGGIEEEVPDLPARTSSSSISVTGSGRFEYRLETDVDGGGDFSLLHYGAGLAFQQELSPDTSLAIKAEYQLDDYDFSGPTGFGGGSNPWEDIHTVGVAAILSVQTAPDWTIYGGPLAQMSQEESFDFGSNSVIFGGLIGATYRVNDQLTLGGGVGIATQIEDSERLFPSIIVRWQIDDHLMLANPAGGGGLRRSGLELIYDYDDDWELAVGGAYDRRRFRIDDEGFNPKGVVEDTSIPFWVRLSYLPSDSFKLNLFAGVSTGGEFEIDDDDGRSISDRDYDDQAVFGASVRIRF